MSHSLPTPGPLARAMAIPLRWLVFGYQITLRPFMGGHCRFQPTCSEYALQALREHGGFRGGWLTVRRLARCHPWGGAGFDPVPGCGCGEPSQLDHSDDGSS